jgi:hypothetical protein
MKVSIDHDGLNVRLFMKVESTKMGKISMIFVNLIGLALLGIALEEWLLGLLAMAALWLIFFGWITLWNFFGKELVIINTKSLSYQHTYGFYITPLETKKINRAMNISLLPAGETKGTPHYNLVFESFNENDLPEELYRTALPISEDELTLLKKYIRRLYFEKVSPDFVSQSYLLN